MILKCYWSLVKEEVILMKGNILYQCAQVEKGAWRAKAVTGRVYVFCRVPRLGKMGWEGRLACQVTGLGVLWTTVGVEDWMTHAAGSWVPRMMTDWSATGTVLRKPFSPEAGWRSELRGHYLGGCGKTNQRGLWLSGKRLLPQPEGYGGRHVESKVFCQHKVIASFFIGGGNTDHCLRFSSIQLVFLRCIL